METANKWAVQDGGVLTYNPDVYTKEQADRLFKYYKAISVAMRKEMSEKQGATNL